jgi:hypothetical protein
MRFRKSIKIAPGVKINLSKSGASTTIGGKGLSANIGSRGAYLNTGISGTGISARHKIAGGGSDPKNEVDENIIPIEKTGGRVLAIISIFLFVFALISLMTGHPVWAFILVIFGGACLIHRVFGRMAVEEESTRP